jgi:hypothetical protein
VEYLQFTIPLNLEHHWFCWACAGAVVGAMVSIAEIAMATKINFRICNPPGSSSRRTRSLRLSVERALLIGPAILGDCLIRREEFPGALSDALFTHLQAFCLRLRSAVTAIASCRTE